LVCLSLFAVFLFGVQSQLEYLRLRSAKHEILVAPRSSFTVIVFQEWGAAAQ
jgi:hypothetical protein